MNKFSMFLAVLLPISISAQSLGKKRIERLQSSVVRILINGNASGTGFFINEDGLLATCWHVFEGALIRDEKSKNVVGLKKVTVEFFNEEVVEAEVILPVPDDEIIYDYVF